MGGCLSSCTTKDALVQTVPCRLVHYLVWCLFHQFAVHHNVGSLDHLVLGMLVHSLYQAAFSYVAFIWCTAQHHQEYSTLPYVLNGIRCMCQQHQGVTAWEPAQMHSVPAASLSSEGLVFAQCAFTLSTSCSGLLWSEYVACVADREVDREVD